MQAREVKSAPRTAPSTRESSPVQGWMPRRVLRPSLLLQSGYCKALLFRKRLFTSLARQNKSGRGKMTTGPVRLILTPPSAFAPGADCPSWCKTSSTRLRFSRTVLQRRASTWTFFQNPCLHNPYACSSYVCHMAIYHRRFWNPLCLGPWYQNVGSC